MLPLSPQSEPPVCTQIGSDSGPILGRIPARSWPERTRVSSRTLSWRIWNPQNTSSTPFHESDDLLLISPSYALVHSQHLPKYPRPPTPCLELEMVHRWMNNLSYPLWNDVLFTQAQLSAVVTVMIHQAVNLHCVLIKIYNSASFPPNGFVLNHYYINYTYYINTM